MDANWYCTICSHPIMHCYSYERHIYVLMTRRVCALIVTEADKGNNMIHSIVCVKLFWFIITPYLFGQEWDRNLSELSLFDRSGKQNIFSLHIKEVCREKEQERIITYNGRGKKSRISLSVFNSMLKRIFQIFQFHQVLIMNFYTGNDYNYISH